MRASLAGKLFLEQRKIGRAFHNRQHDERVEFRRGQQERRKEFDRWARARLSALTHIQDKERELLEQHHLSERRAGRPDHRASPGGHE